MIVNTSARKTPYYDIETNKRKPMKFAKTLVTATEPERIAPYIYALKVAESLDIPPGAHRIMTTGLKIVESPELGYQNGAMVVPTIRSIPGVVVSRNLSVEPVEVPVDAEIKVIVFNPTNRKQTLSQGSPIAYLEVVEKLVFDVEMQ
jgi:hypothetical protein